MIDRFIAGEIIIANELGAISALQSLLVQACPDAYVGGGSFTCDFVGYNAERKDWFAVDKDSVLVSAKESVGVYDFVDLEEMEVFGHDHNKPVGVSTKINPRKVCQGTCESCTCGGLLAYNRQPIKFEASYHAKSDSSFAALVVKGNDEGTAWSHKAWFPFSICSWQEMKGNETTKIIITAPLWYLKEKGIQYSITLYNETTP